MQKIGLIIFLFSIATHAFCAVEAPRFENPPQFNILTIYSGNRSNEACLSVSTGVQTALLSRAVAYSMEAFELNSLYDRDPKRWDRMMDSYMYDIKYDGYDLIIVESEEAFGTFMKRITEIPPHISVIFTNIPNFDLPKIRTLHKNTTAVFRNYDALPNVKTGLKLFPDTKQIILLVSSTNWNEKETAKIRKYVPKKIGITTLFFDNDKPETLQRISETLKNSRKDSILISMGWDRFFANKESRTDLWTWIKKQYSGPIFVRNMVNMDFSLGGVLNRLYTVGAITGELAERVASGTSAGNINPLECTPYTIFNVKEAKRLGLKISDLPEGSNLYNEEESWIKRHSKALANILYTISGIFTAMAVFIVILALGRKKLKLYSKMQKAMPVRICVYDKLGNILYMHMETEDDHNAERDGTFRHVSDLPWIKTESILDAINSVLDTGNPIDMDYEYYETYRSVHLKRLDDSVFGRPAVMSVSRDSSRLQQAREKADETAKHFSIMIQSLSDAVVIVGNDGKISTANLAAGKLFSMSCANIAGEKPEKILEELPREGNESFARFIESLHSRLNDTRTEIAELKLAGGTARRISASASPLKSGDNISGTILVVRDITEIQEENERLATAIEMMGFATRYANISFFRMNMRTEAIFPIASEKLRFCPVVNGSSMPLKQWVLADDLEKFARFARDIKCVNIKYFNDIFRSDFFGVRQYLYIQGTIHKRGSGADAYDELVGVCRDVTMEYTERERNEHSRSIQKEVENIIPYPIYIKDPENNFKYIHCNSAYAEQLGLPIEKITGKTDYDIFPLGSDADIVREHDREAMRLGKQTSHIEEYRGHGEKPVKTIATRAAINAENGRKLLLGFSGNAVSDDFERIFAGGITGIFSALFDSVPVEIFAKDADDDYRYVLWNKMLESQSGIATENVVGKTDAEYAMEYEPALKSATTETDFDLSQKAGSIRAEFNHPVRGKLVYDIYRTHVCVCNRNFVFGACVDVTERQNSESALSDFEKRNSVMNLVFEELSGTSSYETFAMKILEKIAKSFDADIGLIFRHENGFAFKEFEYNRIPSLFLEKYSESDMPSLIAKLKRNETVIFDDSTALPEELLDSQEFLLAKKVKSAIATPIFVLGKYYGEMVFISSEKKGIFPEVDGEILSNVSALFSMAKILDAQRTSINMQTELQSKIFESVPIAMSLFDSDLRLISENAAFAKIFDRKKGVNFGKSCKNACKISGTKYCSTEYCPILYAQKFGKPRISSAPFGDRILEGNAFPIFNSSEKLQYVVQTITDITKFVGEKKNLSTCLKQDDLIKNCANMLLLEPDLQKAFAFMAKSLSEYYSGMSIRIMRSTESPAGFAVSPVSIITEPSREKSIRAISNFHETDFPAIFAQLRDGKSISNNLDEISDSEIPQWKKEMSVRQKQLGFRDAMLFPLFCDGKYWGYMDVDRGNAGSPFNEIDKRIFGEAKRILESVLKRELNKEMFSRSENLTSQLFEKIAVPMLMLDEQRKIKVLNRSFCELFNLKKEDTIGKFCFDCVCGKVDAKMCDSVKCPILHTLKTGKPAELDYPHKGKVFRWRSQPIFDLNGKVKYALDCAFDITDEIENKQRLTAQSKNLESANSTLNFYLEQDGLIAECMQTVILEKDANVAYEKVLAKIGNYIGVDACGLVRYVEDSEAPYSTVRNAWYKSGIPSPTSKIDTRYPSAKFNAVFQNLKTGKTLCADTDNLDLSVPWQREFSNYFDTTGVSELIKVPLNINGKFWGYFGAEQGEATSSLSKNIRLLEKTAHIFQILIIRESMLEKENVSEMEKQLILDTIEFPIILFDADMKIVNANKAALDKKMLGDITINAPACSCCAFAKLCNPEYTKGKCLIKNVLENKKPLSDEHTIGDAHFMLNALPISRNGKIYRVLLNVVDITNSANKQTLANRARKDAEIKASNDNAVFAAYSDNIAKLVSTIITGIGENKNPNDGSSEIIERGKSAVEMLNLMAELAKIEGGGIKISKTLSDTAEIVEKIRLAHSENLAKKSLYFTANFNGEIPKLILDSKILEESLTCFVEASINFTVNGGLLLSVSYDNAINELEISLRDTGEGIEENKINTLLSPEALKNGDVGDINCQRLRLMISYQSIKACGGKVKLQSKRGLGTCLTFTIPAEKAKSENVGTAQPTNAVPSKNILIVDDMLMNLKVLGSILKKQGYTVIEASSAKAALEKLSENTPLCILTDIWMPEINGVEFAKTVRGKSEFDSIPIIAVTADAESDRTFDMSIFESVLIKPVTMDKIKQTLSNFIGK